MNTSPKVHPAPRSRYTLLERLTVAHVIVLLLFTTWALGGNIAWARPWITGGGLLGFALTVCEFGSRLRSRRRIGRAIAWLAPWFLFNALVIVSLMYPSFRRVTIEGAGVFIPEPVSDLLPSTARPDLSLPALLLADATYLAAFNLLFVLRSRTLLRGVFLTFAANAFVLSVFGSLQKLAHATGIFFGAVHSPNETFFASFIYHNHWGAFAILAETVLCGLVFSGTRGSYRDFFHSPRFAYLVALLAVAATLPLSTSRSCTALDAVVLLVALIHGLGRIARHGEDGAPRKRAKIALVVFSAAAALAVIALLAEPMMARRWQQTRAQISEMRHSHSIGERAELYRNTWRMAMDRPLYGWGLASYATVFTRYNTHESPDRLPEYYVDAHSDWLQGIAETGFLGLALRVLMAAVPLASVGWRQARNPLVAYPWFGCALVALYAWIEFPYGNVAVVLSTWICFFGSLRFAQLDAHEAAR